jgi:hypothetical protein
MAIQCMCLKRFLHSLKVPVKNIDVVFYKMYYLLCTANVCIIKRLSIVYFIFLYAQ